MCACFNKKLKKNLVWNFDGLAVESFFNSPRLKLKHLSGAKIRKKTLLGYDSGFDNTPQNCNGDEHFGKEFFDIYKAFFLFFTVRFFFKSCIPLNEKSCHENSYDYCELSY